MHLRVEFLVHGQLYEFDLEFLSQEKGLRERKVFRRQLAENKEFINVFSKTQIFKTYSCNRQEIKHFATGFPSISVSIFSKAFI
jgi:hypothetical protein